MEPSGGIIFLEMAAWLGYAKQKDTRQEAREKGGRDHIHRYIMTILQKPITIHTSCINPFRKQYSVAHYPLSTTS